MRPTHGQIKTFSSLENNVGYRYLWTGNLFANCARRLQCVTIGWLALDITGDAGVLVGIDTTMAIGGAIAVAIGLLFPPVQQHPPAGLVLGSVDLFSWTVNQPF